MRQKIIWVLCDAEFNPAAFLVYFLLYLEDRIGKNGDITRGHGARQTDQFRWYGSRETSENKTNEIQKTVC